MIRLMQLSEDGAPSEHFGTQAIALAERGRLCWLDLSVYDEAELKLVQQRFGFHQLAIDACLKRNQRPRLQQFDEYLLITTNVVQNPAHAGGGHLPQIDDLNTFLAQRYLVTVHRKPHAGLDRVWNQTLSSSSASLRGADYIYYLLLDSMLDEVFPIIDRISEDMEALENAILANSEGEELPKIMLLKRALVATRRLLAPHRDIAARLSRHEGSWVSEKITPYFRDVYDHMVRAYEQVDIERDLLGSAMDAYLSKTSNRLNIIMKQLTILSAIFLPPTFITSFFGQNFTALPFDSQTLLFMELAICVGLPAFMLYWFYRSQWIWTDRSKSGAKPVHPNHRRKITKDQLQG